MKHMQRAYSCFKRNQADLKQPKEVLLAKVPNMSNKEAMALFFEKVKMWRQENTN